MATTDARRGRNGDYVDVSGLSTYYEANGAGDPLLLLHGGFCPAETFDELVPGLAQAYRVYVPERRGHGRGRADHVRANGAGHDRVHGKA